MSESEGAQVALNWQVTELHYTQRTVRGWMIYLPDAGIEMDDSPEECADKINDHLEEGGHLIEEVLTDLASDATWTDSSVDVETAEATVV